jgi:hypothetical protein
VHFARIGNGFPLEPEALADPRGNRRSFESGVDRFGLQAEMERLDNVEVVAAKGIYGL